MNYAIYATTNVLNYAINLTYSALYTDYDLNFASYASHIFTVAAKMLEFLSTFAPASTDTLVSDPTHAFKFEI